MEKVIILQTIKTVKELIHYQELIFLQLCVILFHLKLFTAKK